jgi:hypothetical protein
VPLPKVENKGSQKGGKMDYKLDFEDVIKGKWAGDARPADIAAIGTMMEEFKKGDVYKIIKKHNELTIKNMLIAGRQNSETSEFRLGQLEGIQSAFEEVIDMMINDGKICQQKEKEDGD